MSGVDILQAIAKSKENPVVNDTEGIEQAGDAGEIAVAPVKVGKKEIKEGTKKDAVIAVINTVDSGLKEINEVLAEVKEEDKSVEAASTAETSTSGKNK